MKKTACLTIFLFTIPLLNCVAPAEQRADAAGPLDARSPTDAGTQGDSPYSDSACSDGGQFDHVYYYDHAIPDIPVSDPIYRPDHVRYDSSFDAWCAPPRHFSTCEQLYGRFYGSALGVSDTFRGCGGVEECTLTPISIQCDYGEVQACAIPIAQIDEEIFQQNLLATTQVICGCMDPVDGGLSCDVPTCSQTALFCENNLCGAR